MHVCTQWRYHSTVPYALKNSLCSWLSRSGLQHHGSLLFPACCCDDFQADRKHYWTKPFFRWKHFFWSTRSGRVNVYSKRTRWQLADGHLHSRECNRFLVGVYVEWNSCVVTVRWWRWAWPWQDALHHRCKLVNSQLQILARTAAPKQTDSRSEFSQLESPRFSDFGNHTMYRWLP